MNKYLGMGSCSQPISLTNLSNIARQHKKLTLNQSINKDFARK